MIQPGKFALTAAAVAYARLSTTLERARTAGDRFVGATLAEALTAAERGQLGIALYDVSPRHRGQGLFSWERRWLDRRLPPPPARLLVGACGAGREALVLAAAGYRVDAFDPAASLLALLTERAAAGRRSGMPELRSGAFRYEELAAAVLDGQPSPAATFAGERYDAVLLGWTSLSHVLDGSERRRLIRALDRLCPAGPILASFWSDDDSDGPGDSDDSDGETRAPAETRAEQAGRRVGRALASFRGLPVADGARESFLLDAGFLHRLGRAEVAELAAAAGRSALWEADDGSGSHVTLTPAAPSRE